MNKELTLLEEALDTIDVLKIKYSGFENWQKRLEIVEKALSNSKKEHKALGIIRKNFIPYAIEMLVNGKVRIWIGHDRYFDVTKKEYYLLEGVLSKRRKKEKHNGK